MQSYGTAAGPRLHKHAKPEYLIRMAGLGKPSREYPLNQKILLMSVSCVRGLPARQAASTSSTC